MSASHTALFTRRNFAKLTGAGLLAAAGTSLFGCGSEDTNGVKKVVIGTMATEDFLPMWVAEADDLFDPEQISVEIKTFQSATELQTGIKSGQVDFAMTDPMVSAGIFVSGTNVRIQWITLGTEASQGRFGIMVNAENYASGVTSLRQLSNVPIGVGSNTILEYVMDTLLLRAGVSADRIKKTEVQKLPIRYQNMVDGVVTAAALPGSLLALGEANGCVCLADDTEGDNISQSVMIARADYLESEGGAEVLAQLKAAWDAAVERINNNPESYRSLLVEKANLNETVAETYPISTYPACELPTSEMINPVLTWMDSKGYLEYSISYNPETGAFVPRV